MGTTRLDWLRNNIVRHLAIADDVLADLGRTQVGTAYEWEEPWLRPLLRERQLLQSTLADVELQSRLRCDS